MTVVDSSAEMAVSDLAGIGRALRQARVAKGLTVEDAALELHLQVRQINALEKGDFGGFSSPAFIKGYLRACARLYNVDGDSLIGLYDSFLPSPKIHMPAMVTNSKKHALAPRYRHKIIFFVTAFIASIVIVFSLFWLGSHYWPSEFLYKADNAVKSFFNVGDESPVIEPNASGALNVIESISPRDAPPAASLATASLVDNPVPAVNENQSVMTPSGDIQDSVLHIEFIDDCWVQLKDKDGHVLHEKVHKKGEIFDTSVKAPLHVWFGRAGAVNVSYNGAVVPVPVKQGFQSAQFILGDEPSSGEIE